MIWHVHTYTCTAAYDVIVCNTMVIRIVVVAVYSSSQLQCHALCHVAIDINFGDLIMAISIVQA